MTGMRHRLLVALTPAGVALATSGAAGDASQRLNALGSVPRVTALQPEAAVQAGSLLLALVERGLRTDGDLGDWPVGAGVTSALAGAGVVARPHRRGDEDPSATLRVGMDARNLYLAITARDDVQWAPPESPDWTSDSIQPETDPRHERTAGAYGPHDCEYSLVPGDDAKTRVRCRHAPKGVGDKAKAIPWAAIGTPSRAGGG
jgi:hypothetical protein